MEDGWDLGEGEMSCLRGVASDLEVAAMIDALLTGAETSANVDEFLGKFVKCVPDMFLASMVEEVGIDLEDLSEGEMSCLREWMSDIEVATMLAAPRRGSKCVPDLLLLVVIVETMGIDMEDLSEGEMSCLRATMIANVDEIMAEFFKCVPDLPLIVIVKAMGIDKEDLSEDQRTCLREWVTNAGWDALLAASTIAEFATELAACGLDVSDDHADSIEGATATTVGEAIQGALNYEGDVDFFAFEAEGGVLYQIDVGTGNAARLGAGAV